MASNIDPTKPVDGVPAEKADLRANLTAAKAEIEALQSTVDAALQPSDVTSETLTGRTGSVDLEGGADGDVLTVQGDGSLAVETLPAATEALVIAVSEPDADLTTGTGKVTFRMPYALTLTSVRASTKTAPTGAALIVDINEDGSSVLSTKLTIDAGEKTSTTAATAAVISDSALADDAEITIDVDQVGSTIAGTDLIVTLIGNQ